jgi:hypothetical protein
MLVGIVALLKGDLLGYLIPPLCAGFSAVHTMDRLLTAEEIADRLGMKTQ